MPVLARRRQMPAGSDSGRPRLSREPKGATNRARMTAPASLALSSGQPRLVQAVQAIQGAGRRAERDVQAVPSVDGHHAEGQFHQLLFGKVLAGLAVVGIGDPLGALATRTAATLNSGIFDRGSTARMVTLAFQLRIYRLIKSSPPPNNQVQMLFIQPMAFCRKTKTSPPLARITTLPLLARQPQQFTIWAANVTLKL